MLICGSRVVFLLQFFNLLVFFLKLFFVVFAVFVKRGFEREKLGEGMSVVGDSRKADEFEG